MNRDKILESTSVIRFPDCDPFNHLNNSRYLDYFINAREDQLMEAYQFSPYQYAKEKGLSWVVGQNQIAYLRPATLMEKVVFTSRILQLRERDILVEMMMWNKDKTQLKSLLWTIFVHYNFQTGKSEIHSTDLIDYFKPFEDPLENQISFEERFVQLKKQFNS